MPTLFHTALRRSALTLIALGSLAAAAAPSMAQTTVSGTFVHDDDKFLYNFNLATSGYYSFYTTSYAGTGGPNNVTNADGSTTAAGGFDPILTLFDGTGSLVFAEDDDQSGTLNADPTTGSTFDSYFRPLLSTGNYTLVVTEYDNFSNDTLLADGFQEDGQGDFTSKYITAGDTTTTSPFVDVTGTKRTGDFTFNIAPASGPLLPPPAVPEASTTVSFGLLLALGLGGMTVAARRRKAAAAS